MAVGSLLQIFPFSSKPPAPPAGQFILYTKTDNTVYIQDGLGNEYAFGSTTSITQLVGEATGIGPGVTTVTLSNSAVIGKVLTGFTAGPSSPVLATDTILQAIQKIQAQVNSITGGSLSGDVTGTLGATVVSFVGGKTAAQVATSVNDTIAATSANTASTLVKRDAGGDINVSHVNGVSPEAHASRHLPSGADPIPTAAPASNLDSTTTNATGSANSLSRSDHSHAITSGTPVTQTPDQANAAGTASGFAKADHVHAIATAAPSADLTANTNNTQGVSTSFSRSDHSHKIDTGIPVTQTPDQSNAAGTSANLAKADHIHDIPTSAPIATLSPATTNSAGTAASFARGDHSHAIATSLVGDITTIQPDATASAGVVDKFARGDHRHAIVADPAITQNTDQANSEGSSTSFARADHIHNIPTDVAVDVGTSNSQGSSTKFSKADHVHLGVRSINANGGPQRFGNITLSSGVGATVTDNGSGNFTVDVDGGASELFVSYPGSGLSLNYTAGKVIFNGTETFISAGSISVSASIVNGYVYVDINGTVQSGATLPPNRIPLAIFTTGLSSVTFLEDARVFLAQDLVWGLVGDIQPETTTSSASAGTSEKYARADHVHAITSGTPVTQNPDQANAAGSSANFSKADHVHNIPTAAAVTLNAASTNTDGAGTSFSRNDHTHAISSGSAVTQTPDQANATGTSTNFARADHVHDIPTAAPISDLTTTTTNAQGSASTFARSDHSHAIDSGTPVTQTPDQANASGTAATFAKSDHIHNIPTAAPTTTLSPATSNSAGVASSFAKSDHTHAVATSLVGDITTIQPDATASAGVVDKFARGDHRHAIVADPAITQTPDQANAEGSATSFSRADHVHNIPTGVASGLNTTSTNTQGSAAAFARQDHTHAIASGAPSTQTPDQANAAGTSVNFSKADHIHNIPTSAPVADLTPNTTNSDGSASTFSRSDHSHAIDSGTPVTQTPDQSNAAGSAATFAKADHIHNIPSGAVVQVGTTNFQGAASSFSLSDHVHAHGNQTSPTLHAVATNAANGFMSAADKAKLDTVSATAATDAQILISNGTTYRPETVSGDVVITDTGVTTVNSVGGSSAANIHSAELAANAATSSNTPSTIVKRDGSGGFSAGPIVAQSVEINGTAGAGFVQLDAQSATPANPPSGDLRLYTNTSNGFTRTREVNSDGTVFALDRDLYQVVYNTTGSTIAKGKAVYASGVYTGGSPNVLTIALAQSNSPTTATSYGITLESIANNSFGRIMTAGNLTGFDLSAFTNGQAVYLSSTVAGGLTATEPLSPNISQLIGYITNAAVSGNIDLAIRSGLNTASGTYRSSFQIGPASGSSDVDLQFANAFVGTLAWNPTVSHQVKLPPTQGAAGTSPVNDGSGNLSWSNLNTNIDGGKPDSVYTPSQFINGGTP